MKKIVCLAFLLSSCASMEVAQKPAPERQEQVAYCADELVPAICALLVDRGELREFDNPMVACESVALKVEKICATDPLPTLAEMKACRADLRFSTSIPKSCEI